MSAYIKVSVNEGIQRIQIARPEKKNALTFDMYAALASALRAANDQDNILVTILTGTGDSYCSGNDIQDFLQHPLEDQSNPVIDFIHTIIHAEKPLLTAVNGIAVGVGATMLLHCDLVYAADSAAFQFPFVNIGLCPEAGSSTILPTWLGHQRAAELLLLGDSFDAAAARDMGIVNAVVADAQTAAMAAAKRISRQPPAAVRITKKLLRDAMLDKIKAAVQRENEYFLPMLKGAEAKEALSAFMEKRKPDFSKTRK